MTDQRRDLRSLGGVGAVEVTEIALQEIAEPLEVVDEDVVVQAEALAKLFMLLGCSIGEKRDGRIPRQEAHENCDSEGREHENEQRLEEDERDVLCLPGSARSCCAAGRGAPAHECKQYNTGLRGSNAELAKEGARKRRGAAPEGAAPLDVTLRQTVTVSRPSSPKRSRIPNR